MRSRRLREYGMTLIEVMVTLGVLAISIGGFAMVVLSTQNSTTDMRQRDMVRAQGVKYMERLLRIPYGSQFDPTASAAQVQQFFDDDTTVAGTGLMTLKSLETAVGQPGWRFVVEGFEVEGVWAVEINSDLDGNGVFTGTRGTDTPTTGNVLHTAGNGTSVVTLNSENDSNLMRVEIFWNGESVLKSFRAAPVEGS